MQRLRRVTNRQAFLPEIDGLRFVAILSVVLVHIRSSLTHNSAVPNHLDPLIPVIAKRGVELFFIISGFILALPFLRAARPGSEPVSILDYYIRRLTRLEPPYVLSLLICVLAAVVAKTYSLKYLAPHLLASVFYCHYLVFRESNPISFITWSLEVEVQFYLVVPLLARVFVKNVAARRVLLALAIFGSCALSTRLAGGFWQGTALLYAPFFLCGLLLADLHFDPPSPLRGNHAIWDVIALALWPLVWLLGGRYDFTLIPLVLSLLFLSAFRGLVSPRFLRLGWITDVGGMCYSIYLLHVVILSSVTRITKPLHIGNRFDFYFTLQTLLVLPVIFGVCLIFYLLIERPCMDKKWPQKLWNQLPIVSRKFNEDPISNLE